MTLSNVGSDEILGALSRMDGLPTEIARGRRRLLESWRTGTQAIDVARARADAVSSALAGYTNSLNEVKRNFGESSDPAGSDVSGLGTDPGHWIQQQQTMWVIRPKVASLFSKDLEEARKKFIESRSKTFGGGARKAGRIALGRMEVRIGRLREVEVMLKAELGRAELQRAETARAERAQADAALEPAASMARIAAIALPAQFRSWTDPAWDEWREPDAIPGVNAALGGYLTPVEDPELGLNSSFGCDQTIPWILALGQNIQLVHNPATRGEAVSLARSLLLRRLASTRPGDLTMSFYDPVGLGQSAAELLDLAEYDAGLIGGKVWSSPPDLAARLSELTSHIELVIQKYLRSTYDTIDEFNAAAGEIAEPYRQLILFDFPQGLTEETFGQLMSIVANGPRCGVHSLLVTNTGVPTPYGVETGLIAGNVRRINTDALFSHEHQGYRLGMRLSPAGGAAAAQRLAKKVVDAVGRESVGRTEQAVTFEKVFGLFADVARRGIRSDLSAEAAATVVDDPTTWWRDSSVKGLSAPVGQKGARDAAILSLDSGDRAGALLVGRPGSGKSTLLHSYIGGLTTLYGPDELELYLIDFKEGVEFKAYGEERLPHARVVALESDREFGLSVLQSLEAELSQRGELFRATGGKHSGLRALREASGEKMPRILLVFDEFQVLFARNDRLGLAAADLLETIVRQGRGFGIHVLLGSQSLAGLDALGSHVLQLLPVRILLPAAEQDARKVLGEDNDAGKYLTTHGEGILNPAGGAVEANERFKGALQTELARLEKLRQLRAKADAEGWRHEPTVFEGGASIPLDRIDPTVFREELAASGTSPIRLRAGSAMAVAGTADLDLRREAGSNVLVVVRDGSADEAGIGPSDGPAYGLLTAAVASASMSTAQVDIIDFMSVDDGLDVHLEPLLDQGRITLRRRRAFAGLVSELAADVQERIDQDDTHRQPRVTFLFGIHRARELDESGSLDADLELSESLESILRDGPEVGVHTWLWADTVGGAARRLSSRMMRECSWRVAGRMSDNDSLSLIGSEQAADIRERQILLSNDDRSLSIRAISYAPPSKEWLRTVLDA